MDFLRFGKANGGNLNDKGNQMGQSHPNRDTDTTRSKDEQH